MRGRAPRHSPNPHRPAWQTWPGFVFHIPTSAPPRWVFVRNKANFGRSLKCRVSGPELRRQPCETKPIPGKDVAKTPYGVTTNPGPGAPNKANFGSSGFSVLPRLLGLRPKPRHLTLFANSMLRTAEQAGSCEVDPGRADTDTGRPGVAARVAPQAAPQENIASESSCHAIGPKRKMPGGRGQRPREDGLQSASTLKPDEPQFRSGGTWATRVRLISWTPFASCHAERSEASGL